MFDSGKKGSIEKEKVRTILNTLGQSFDDKELESLLKEQDPKGACLGETISHVALVFRCIGLSPRAGTLPTGMISICQPVSNNRFPENYNGCVAVKLSVCK